MKYYLIGLVILICSSSFGQEHVFFNQADSFFKTFVNDDGVDYKTLSTSRDPMRSLKEDISTIDYSKFSTSEKKAYLINVYNILVIHQIKESYPIDSPQDIIGFFDKAKYTINGSLMSLNDLEKKELFSIDKDPRLHFALVCGAKSCPPLARYAFKAETLDQQLTSVTENAIRNNSFIRYDQSKNSLAISKIFEWYSTDFGGEKNILNYINKFSEKEYSTSTKVSYYDYDWSINESLKTAISTSKEIPSTTKAKTVTGSSMPVKVEQSDKTTKSTKPNSTNQDKEDSEKTLKSNVQSYTPSSLLKNGQTDLTFFNTLYTQDRSNWMGDEFSGTRETFYTGLIQTTYGISKNARINIGIDLSFKSSGSSSSDKFSKISRAFEFQNNDSTRYGLSSIAFRVKIAPFKKFSNFSIESSFAIPIMKDLEGRQATSDKKGLGFLDWDRYIWWNRFYYDKTFNKVQLFTEADLLFRIKTNSDQYNALDLPISLFFSYFINSKTTVYIMGQHQWRYRISKTSDNINDAITTPANYSTYGFGGKYQLSNNLNIEVLFTDFFRSKNSGLGETYNVGLKYLW